MKSLKFFSALAIVASLLFSFSSCKKGNDSVSKNTVTKDQLAGKWNMSIQANGIVTLRATLKASGSMELDQPPYDGIADIILLWDVTNNNFTAHLDANGISNYWKLNASIDPKTLSMTGELIANNDPNPPQTALFTMDKQ